VRSWETLRWDGRGAAAVSLSAPTMLMLRESEEELDWLWPRKEALSQSLYCSHSMNFEMGCGSVWKAVSK
jgi:hypothetical protein